MKNFSLLLLAAFALSLGGCSKDAPEPSYRTGYAEIPDECFREYCLQMFDRDRDGRISVGEAELVREIDCSVSLISSLEGIGFFTRLEELRCIGSGIRELDLSGNKALKRLYCFQCSRLSSLDVSQNPALEILNCCSCALSWLDVTRNGALEALVCSNNPLSALNVSHNPELWALWCDYTGLESLNVSRNPKLTTLNCSGLRSTILDLSRCVGLRELECERTELSSLDVSMCPALEKLYASELPVLYMKKEQRIEHFLFYGEIRYKD